MKRYSVLLFLVLSLQYVWGQGTVADYKRARELRAGLSNKVNNLPGQFNWNETGDLFWYSKSVDGKRAYVLVTPATKKAEPLFEVDAVFSALGKQLGRPVSPTLLGRNEVQVQDINTLTLNLEGFRWTWDRRTNTLTKAGASERRERGEGYWGRRSFDNSYREVESPDKQYVAFIRNFNLYMAPKGALDKARQLTFDGNNQEYYDNNIAWSSDSKKLATMKVQKVDVRQLTLIESSPKDQLQPKLQTRDYVKPGDALPQRFPVVYNITQERLYTVNPHLVENQFELNNLAWRKNGTVITFEFNKRGHQQYAVVELDATTGQSRYLIDEKSDTFIDYSSKKYRNDVNDGREIIWASERDGWNHLYLYDGNTGKVKNQITKGNWVVRKVINVDEAKRQIIFEGSGRNNGQDPYLIQYYAVDFDGKSLKALTTENGEHQATFNKDHTFFVDLYSRVDQAPVAVLKDASGRIVMELEKADIQPLAATGWKAPEVFAAKGRDGATDIWGIIIRPSNFDASKRYPVIEYIYAGPHSSFVPKSFYANPSGMYELAELGFIVVQIDGMGTSNRSKAFHNVAWKNLKDAGFPDRILWMKAAAQKYPYMDLEKVGIYGTSAGGQSSAAALLFHPEFYKVGVSSCGCHDNRMDKIWWNEQWMGWPIGPQYAACSNIENAGRLEGKLMLIVGELDDNVDPSTTYQFTNALIKAGKNHELIVVPGMGHSSGGEYGEKKRRDFFVKNLLGVDPPAWNLY